MGISNDANIGLSSYNLPSRWYDDRLCRRCYRPVAYGEGTEFAGELVHSWHEPELLGSDMTLTFIAKVLDSDDIATILRQCEGDTVSGFFEQVRQIHAELYESFAIEWGAV